jgi:hypothetical protein
MRNMDFTEIENQFDLPHLNVLAWVVNCLIKSRQDPRTRCFSLPVLFVWRRSSGDALIKEIIQRPGMKAWDVLLSLSSCRTQTLNILSSLDGSFSQCLPRRRSHSCQTHSSSHWNNDADYPRMRPRSGPGSARLLISTPHRSPKCPSVSAFQWRSDCLLTGSQFRKAVRRHPTPLLSNIALSFLFRTGGLLHIHVNLAISLLSGRIWSRKFRCLNLFS